MLGGNIAKLETTYETLFATVSTALDKELFVAELTRGFEEDNNRDEWS